MAQDRILIIDDSPETHRLLAELVLDPKGYRHLSARDGAEGLRLAVKEQPDLIILDMQMPKMNGIEVLKALREKGIKTPVIVASVIEVVDVAVQVFRLGAYDYIIKPFDPQEMLESIERVLADSKVREERDQLTTKLLQANKQLQRQLQELNAIYTIGRSVTSLLDLDQVLNRVVEAAVYVAHAEEGLLLLLDRSSDELYLRAAKDIEEKVARKLRLRVTDSIAGRAIRTDRPVQVTGKQTKIATGYLVKSLLYLPLRVPDQGVIGVLGVTNRETDRTFSERDIYLLSALADYAAVAIDNARLFEEAEIERAKLEAVLQEAQEAVIVISEKGDVLLCNAAAQAALKLPQTDLLGCSAQELLSHATLQDMLSEMRASDQAVRREVALEKRTFNAQLTPIQDVGGVLVMQDITHLKELDRIRSEFVATVSHDIRTPLTNILGYIELLPRAGPLNKRQQEFIDRVRESMESITELIGDLLDIGRIEAGFDLEMKPCSLLPIIKEAIHSFEASAKRKRQELRLDLPESLPQIQGNPRVLRQVMENLISNAVKYTHEGGWIAVSTEERKDYVIVCVSDNGIGIPPAQQPHVFDRFYRVDSQETVNISGTGLGLAIVKTAIEKHNGRVWVESKPGFGSSFCFVLPKLQEDEGSRT